MVKKPVLQSFSRYSLDTVSRISTAADGSEGNNNSSGAKISADGRYVVFTSLANNLVTGDTNALTDIFRKDLTTGAVLRVSIGAGDVQGNGPSSGAHISADGRYVVFESYADNLVAGDGNGKVDIFRKDLNTGAIVRVSTAADGAQGNGDSTQAHISADDRYVVFESTADTLVAGDTNGQRDVFRKDLVTGEIILISSAANDIQGNHASGGAQISADGRYVMFASDANNLIAGDTNGTTDVFLADLSLKTGAGASQGRSVKVKFDTGAASSVSMAWGDGTVDKAAPVGGSVSFSHTYASTGTKSAITTVVERSQSWAVPYLVNLAAGTMTRDTVKADVLTGGNKADRLTGDKFANIIRGQAGNDVLKGLVGHDKLWGGYGADVLFGGAGKDTFVFDTKPHKKKNFDKIADYNVKDDSIWLDNAVFKKIGKGSEVKPGKLSKAFFKVTGKLKDKNDYVLYNKKTGILSYDEDGSGTKAAVEIAKLSKNPGITAADIFVI